MAAANRPMSTTPRHGHRRRRQPYPHTARRRGATPRRQHLSAVLRAHRDVARVAVARSCSPPSRRQHEGSSRPTVRWEASRSTPSWRARSCWIGEPTGEVLRGPRAVRSFFEWCIAINPGGGKLDPCSLTDDGHTCVLESASVPSSSHPDVQVGLAAYERSPGDRIRSFRISTNRPPDLGAPAPASSRRSS